MQGHSLGSKSAARHCLTVYGNGTNTLMLSNSGKTLLILYDETVVKLCLKAIHKVNTSNSSRQVVSMALNTESTTQYLDYSYWLKACFFFSLPSTMLSWVSVCMEQLFLTRLMLIGGSEIIRRTPRRRCCQRIKIYSTKYVPLFIKMGGKMVNLWL